MAAADTFYIFEKVHQEDKFLNFDWFKKFFENATDPEIKSEFEFLLKATNKIV